MKRRNRAEEETERVRVFDRKKREKVPTWDGWNWNYLENCRFLNKVSIRSVLTGCADMGVASVL